ncbi:MAG: secretin N-terminal domain-containing protein [Candidatus Omnitrophota bacterium]
MSISLFVGKPHRRCSGVILCLCLFAFFGFSHNFVGAQEEEVSSAASDGGAIKDVGAGKISLDLKGVDIVELLKILSMKMSANIVPTKDVAGRINVFLNNVTYEDALDIILLSNSLAAVREKNIITVMTTERYQQLYGQRYNEPRKIRTIKLKHAAPRDVFTALSQLKSDVGKLVVDEPSGTVIMMDVPEALDLMDRTVLTLDMAKETEIFTLSYATADDVKAQLATVLTPGASNVEVDKRTNKIAITDLPDKMKKIKTMIKAFDAEPKQVLIEAQIVQIALTDRTQYGIDWEKLFNQRKMRSLDLAGPYSIAGLDNNLSVGVLTTNHFNILMQALNTIAKSNVLSRPRIAVVNNEEATILIGAKEVYFTSTTSQGGGDTTVTAESVNYIDVGVKLSVTPTISEDGFVLIKIKPEVSSVREYVTSVNQNRVPVISTSQAETTVKVKDKAMVMIAGLMKETITENRSMFPFLGKLPILKWIFGNSDTSKAKEELAIFLTPRIITGDIERIDAEKEQVKSRGTLTKRIRGLEE